MKKLPRFELVSFDLCPYVQRSVITLLHKKIPFETRFIDLSAPPEWFNAISPLGKVPVLLVHEEGREKPAVIFESAVINEYLDEVTPPHLAPSDPLARAQDRAWFAVASELTMAIYMATNAETEGDAETELKEFWETLEPLEREISGEKTFRSSGFSLLDSTFAPVFTRAFALPQIDRHPSWKNFPKTRKWAEALLTLPEVKESVPVDFQEKYMTYLKKNGSAWAAKA